MSDKETNTRRGISFGSLLCLLFIGLKLTGHIDWSWLWVLAPIWIPFALVVTVILMGCLFVGAVTVLETVFFRRK